MSPTVVLPAGSGGGGIAAISELGAIGGSVMAGSHFYLPGWSYRNTGETVEASDDRIYYTPIFVQRAHTFAAIAVYGGFGGNDWGANAVARLGVYNAGFDADDRLEPTSLLVDSGTVNLDTAGLHEIVADIVLEGGTWYYLAIATDRNGGTDGSLDAPFTDYVAAPFSSWHNGNPGAASNYCLRQVLADAADNGLPDPAAPTVDTNPTLAAKAFLRD